MLNVDRSEHFKKIDLLFPIILNSTKVSWQICIFEHRNSDSLEGALKFGNESRNLFQPSIMGGTFRHRQYVREQKSFGGHSSFKHLNNCDSILTSRLLLLLTFIGAARQCQTFRLQAFLGAFVSI